MKSTSTTEALVPAQPIPWPNDYKAAACFGFDLDAEAVFLHSHPESASRMSVMSHQSYGPLVGVPRLLEILARRGIKATFFTPGFTAERYPDVIKRIVDEGHEIGHHGYLHEVLIGIDEKTEAEYLDRGLEALDKAAAVRPVGFRAPMWEINYHTPGLLESRGFLYDSSLFDSDYPYELRIGPGRSESIIEIPVQWALDDWEQYCYVPEISGTGLIETPTKAAELWSLEFRALRKIGGCFALTGHPFLSGRPSRAEALEGVMEETLNAGDVWVTTLAEVANHTRSLGLDPRTLLPPDLRKPRQDS